MVCYAIKVRTNGIGSSIQKTEEPIVSDALANNCLGFF
jgi:hypothetical protein